MFRVAQDPSNTWDIFTYSGPDVMTVFNHFKEQVEFISDVLLQVVKINPFTEKEQKNHTDAKKCKLCSNYVGPDKLIYQWSHYWILHWIIL